ncbi:MAG: ABC transporter permease subunit [Anaerolineales bacterium]|nr:ABC transporter permease subunit [Anaerolineales bacterium]
MRNVFLVARREFKLFFVSPIAYVVAILFFVILGVIFYLNISFAMQGGQITPDGRIVMSPLVTILIFATPAITMRLLADEQKTGTIELLLTSPVRDWELVVGKWLGAVGFMVILLAVTWIYPLIIHQLTEPGIDQGVLVSAYIGLLLLEGTLLAIGTFISALFNNSVAAFFVTLAVMLTLWIVGGFATDTGSGSEIARNLSFLNHYYDNLFQGVVDIGDLIYFISLTVLALFLGTQVIGARRWV